MGSSPVRYSSTDKYHIALSDSKFYSKVSFKGGPRVKRSVELTTEMKTLVHQVLVQKSKAEYIMQGINDMNQTAQDNIEQVRQYETDDQDILPIDWGRKRNK